MGEEGVVVVVGLSVERREREDTASATPVHVWR
jgi:hypothetical protein